MKTFISSRNLFILGFVILLLTNIVVLLGVYFNRSGKHEIIILTERELSLPSYVDKENSGLRLNIQWRTLGIKDNMFSYSSHWTAPSWFNTSKLNELGIKAEQDIPKEVFIVLENNASLYNKSVKNYEKNLQKKQGDELKNAEREFKKEQTSKSRLFAIDAGLDYKALKQKYSIPTRYIITKGLVKPDYSYNKNEKENYGIITQLSIKSIHVPIKHRKIFDSILAQKKANSVEFQPPRYEVELAYGSRLEPWILSVNPINNKSK